jgi:hypothetical protein
MAFMAFDVSNETNATSVVFIDGVIKTLRFRAQ